MIGKIRRAEDPAWHDSIEQQQGIARLGRMFGRNESPLVAMLDGDEPLDHRQVVGNGLLGREGPLGSVAGILPAGA